MDIIEKKDSPGVFIPPPLIYAAIFFVSLPIQKVLPMDRSFFYSAIAANLGIIFIICSVVFFVSALVQFMRSRNSIILTKSARSLQTTGIYSITRNPMYFALLLLYVGIAIVKGNWWTILFIPLLVFVIQFFVIRREEAYLDRAFGQDYTDYKKRVRRWI